MKRLITALTLFFGFLRSALAGEFTDPIPIPPGNEVTLGKIGFWISRIAAFLLEIGAIVVAAAFVVSGIMWATAGSSDRAQRAKDIFKGALVGGLIFFGIGVILATIKVIISGSFFF